MIVYAFVVLTVLGIISTILNSFLLVVFIKGFANLKKLPYIIFCWQILICNLTGLFVKFAYVIPNSAWDNDKVSHFHLQF
uniref:7TM GPCR serpentine receptor class x (Srx) domain-containing protein n=1 Tax=Panagrolaimus sp. PS1159 TaxID=55785 RepID=A0AC35FTW8_9BILA